MKAASQRAKACSDAALPRLQQRFRRLGYSEADLTSALHYVTQEAPLLIHFKPQMGFGFFSTKTVLKAFLEDTHYRSTRETGIGGGARGVWREKRERILFAGLYLQDSSPFEHFKYGSLNVFKEPGGSAPRFGPCYIELKSDVMERCTFVYRPSFDDLHQVPGTRENFAHTLAEFDDKEIACLVERRPFKLLNPTVGGDVLVEVQIHGPLEFKRDIKELRFPRSTKRKVQKRLQRSICANFKSDMLNSVNSKTVPALG
ncbi:hypothetical protein KFL_001750090 [Klebsormidium nitens]|uniref:Uncharacterized protein n=1 Tax=Klebsormidium nitens TaxID=105231 RepID=A0A1Y1I286_KLENI|nr:hypothetical protein KFL_001750090 [Klebsormidium nitens]|eukprot:GAQ84072.1 hypothetical protein KFL_001750090 [Klebsormidium nitens]